MSDPRFLDFPLRGWMEKSHLFQLRHAVNETRRLIGNECLDELVSKGVSCQKAVYALLHKKLYKPELSPTIVRRMTTKLQMAPAAIPVRMMSDNIRLCFKRLKPCVGFAVMRLFCGGLCTSSAFGEERECRWGCDHKDKLVEILGCQEIQNDIAASIGWQIVPRTAVECFYFIGNPIPGISNEQWILCRCIYMLLLNNYYNHRKANPFCCRSFPDALCKQLAGHCNKSRELLRILRLYRPRMIY